MEDINALNKKLQTISKTLEDFQATTLLQEEKIRQSMKQRAENDDLANKIRENLACVDKDVSSEQVTSHYLIKTTIHLQTEFDSSQFRLSRIPMVIGKLCIDYERKSTKLRRKIEALSTLLKTNEFWSTPTKKAYKETEYFREILEETQQSRREFSSSEEIRLRNELEIEESRLSYLQACIADATQATLTSPQYVSAFHSDRQPHNPPQKAKQFNRKSTPNPVTPPRESPHSSDQEQHAHDTRERETQQSVKRHSLFPSYTSIYPRPHSGDDLPAGVVGQEDICCEDSQNNYDDSAGPPWENHHHHAANMVSTGEIALTVSSSTTTVTKRTVLWTEPDSNSYRTSNTVIQASHPSSWPIASYINDSNNGGSDNFDSSGTPLIPPSPCMRVPEVPWFREFKRRRFSAAFSGNNSTTTVAAGSSFPVEYEELTIDASLARQHSTMVNKSSRNSAFLDDMDLYDTSGSEGEAETPFNNIVHSKQQSSTKLNSGTSSNQIRSNPDTVDGTIEKDLSAWSSEKMPSPQDIPSHNRTSVFPKKSNLASRFHTGLALIRSSKHS